MKNQITCLSFFLMTLVTLQGQVVQESLPGAEEISNRRTSFNLDEIKVRWKKAALENCTGVPCVVTPPAPSFTCGTSTVSDIDGNAYNTVLIGTQCWIKSNLKVTKYNDGTAIPLDATGGSDGITGGENWSTQLSGAYTIYGNEASSGTNVTNYGYLYNWYAVSDLRKLCPTGWHVPTRGEWIALETQLGGPSFAVGAGGKMKLNSPLWDATPFTTVQGNNSSGFSGLPGGIRTGNNGNPSQGMFDYGRGRGYFWSASAESTPGYAYARVLNASNNSLSTDSFSRFSEGQSVRCLRD